MWKKPTTSSVLISGRSEKALVSLLHKCAVSPMTIFHMLLQKKWHRLRFRPNIVPSKAVALLLIPSLMFLLFDCRGSVIGPCFVMQYFSVYSSFAIILTRKREHDALLLLPSYYKCSVALSHGDMGWSEVCDCGTSWSYSLSIYGPVHASLVFIA